MVEEDQDTLCRCRTAGRVVAGFRLDIRYRGLGSEKGGRKRVSQCRQESVPGWREDCQEGRAAAVRE